MKCERCQKNPAGVRIDEIVNGKRVQHYLCRQCVDELMSTSMNQSGGLDGHGNPDGAPFGFLSNNAHAASSAGGVNTATAVQLAKTSKTLPLDQSLLELTDE